MLKTNTLDDGELRYFREGKGSTLVFLHGYPDNLQVWSNLIPLMVKDFDLLAFDWPGMGYSSAWKGGTAPTEQAKRLVKILDRFGLDKIHLVAHDMGGQAALVAASLFPERISSVVVMNSLVMWNAKTSWEIKYLRNFKLNNFFLTFFPKLVFKRAIGTFGNKGMDDEVKKDLWNSFRKPSVRKFIVRLCAGYQAQLPRLPKYYEKITCPVNILWGGKGKHFHTDHAKKLREVIPGSEVNILPEAQHWMVYFDAAMINEQLRRFYAVH